VRDAGWREVPDRIAEWEIAVVKGNQPLLHRQLKQLPRADASS
jgi:hypothetical protein